MQKNSLNMKRIVRSTVISVLLTVLGAHANISNELHLSFNKFTYSAGKYFVKRVSWYGRAKHILVSRNKVLNHNDLFAASRTLPFGTKILVENPENGKKVIVKVEDRGPYVYSRWLDLSYGAAKKLGMIKQGVINAKIKLLTIGHTPIKYFNYVKHSISIDMHFLEPMNAFAQTLSYNSNYNMCKINKNNISKFFVINNKYLSICFSN